MPTGTLGTTDNGATIATITGFVGAFDTSGAGEAGHPPAPIGEGPPGSLAQAAHMSWMRRVVDVINNMQTGKLNCTGIITLTPGASATVISDPRIGPFSQIRLSPLSASAAGITWYISAQQVGQATIAHSVSAAVDLTFTYSVLG